MSCLTAGTIRGAGEEEATDPDPPAVEEAERAPITARRHPRDLRREVEADMEEEEEGMEVAVVAEATAAEAADMAEEDTAEEEVVMAEAVAAATTVAAASRRKSNPTTRST